MKSFNPRQTVEVPSGASILFAERSSSGGLNLWTIGGDPDENEKRAFFAVRTGVEVPSEILDATHVGTYSGVHVFQLAPGTAKQFSKAETGFE